MNDKSEVDRSRWMLVAFLAGMILATMLCSQAEAKDCSIDGTAGLNPFYNQTIVTTGSIAPGDTLASMGESNTKQIFNEVRRSDITLLNTATGGCTIGGYARSSSKCWDNMPASADVIWMKPINRSQGIDPSVYVAALEQDIVGALTEISERMTGVKEVWMSGHHATPYAEGWIDRNGNWRAPKQEEPYSHDAIVAIDNVIAQYQGAYSFRLVNAAYLWANANKQRADGLQWSCDDFGNDGVHLSSDGNKKAAGLLEDYIANALGAEPPPPVDPPDDPPPVDPPENCPVPGWAERKGMTCSWSDKRDQCVCR